MARVQISAQSALYACGREELGSYYSLHFDRSTATGLRSVNNIRESTQLAARLVHEAVEAGLIGPRQPGRAPGRLFILGGGPAGISAALAASRARVPVTLVEANELCSRFRECSSRWLDPFVYDWPSDSWRQMGIVSNWESPLAWEGGPAAHISEHWVKQLHEERTAKRLIELSIPRTDLTVFTELARKPGYGPREHSEHFLRIAEPNPTHPRYSMYLACCGIPEEDCSGGADSLFQGYGFWQNDQLDTVDLGSEAAPTRALVSGGGDGGCQDFLRLAFGEPRMREIIEKLSGAVERAGLASTWQTEVIAPLVKVEDLAPDRAQQHAACDGIVASIAGPLWRTLSDALRRSVRLEPKRHELVFAYRGEALSAQYPLNRFAVLLLARWLREERGCEALHSDRHLLNVSGATHECDGNPDACFGEEHCVTFSPGDATLEEKLFRTVVIRHGARWRSA